MDNYHQVQMQDIGILRKKEGKEEELFVFGYSCKVYENYEKSLYVDQGKHLIPWLGDETLKIDRYDCRGALNDLGAYLPKSEGFDRRASLSNEEKRIEALCDQERFRALTVNEEDEILYQEEELKRLQKALNNENTYGEVGFNYDDESKSQQESAEKENNEEADEDEAFIPPFQLDVPVGMKIPKSRKHHEIIERTAFFINDQGAQMEILLKMKQAENTQFNFLSFDNDLHPYYRHMLTAIKSQRYKPTQSAPTEKESPKESIQEDTYLHPSLVQNSTSFVLPESAPKIPTINYKPSVNCTYSALVNRIKETQSATRESSLLDGIRKGDWTSAHEKLTDNSEEAELGSHSPIDQNDEYAKSLSSLPLSALTKSARRRRIRKEKYKAAAASFKLYYTEENMKNQNDEIQESDSLLDKSPVKDDGESLNVVPVLKPIPAPAPVVQIPPADIQLIIDKMASYVAKNGHDFENVVRAKGDPRFSFLDKNHVYNPYYNQKVQLYLQLESLELVQSSQQIDSKLNSKMAEVNIKKLNAKFIKTSKSYKPIPICFSIKKPKDQETLEIKSALPCEESEREDDEGVEVDAENIVEKTEEEDDKLGEIADVDRVSPPSVEVTPVKKATDMTLEKWAQERLKAKLVIAAKEKLAAKDKDKQLQAERRKKAAEFINLLQKDNLVNKIQTSDNTNSAANGKKDISDIITIPSDSSSTDSDSVVSVPLSSGEEEKLKNAKRKGKDLPDPHLKKKKRKDRSHGRSTDRKLKQRSRSSSYNRSPSYSRHGVKKYEKEKKSHSRKKKHHHYRSRSSSYKKSHRSPHKSKRSKFSNDGSERSDSACSYISVSDVKKVI